MQYFRIKSIFILIFSFVMALESQAKTVEISLTRLSGSTAEGTAVFRADLTSLDVESIRSITLLDSNSKVGGSAGQYSGFDLDAIKLSHSFVETATEVSSSPSVNEFNFDSSGTLFTPGSQRDPKDQKLNGTDDSGQIVDKDFATLDLFDGIFFGTGSVSLGDGGSITFNLNQDVSVNGLYLYIGEVSGSAGEGINGTLLISDTIIADPNCSVPEPVKIGLDLGIKIPSAEYQSLSGTSNIWADLEYLGTNPEGRHIWGLKDYGFNQ